MLKTKNAFCESNLLEATAATATAALDFHRNMFSVIRDFLSPQSSDFAVVAVVELAEKQFNLFSQITLCSLLPCSAMFF